MFAHVIDGMDVLDKMEKIPSGALTHVCGDFAMPARHRDIKHHVCCCE